MIDGMVSFLCQGIICYKKYEHYRALTDSLTNKTSEGKLLIAKFEFGRSFGMSFVGDCHEVEVTYNLELLVTFYKLGGSLS
jgi:hypothetical protein